MSRRTESKLLNIPVTIHFNPTLISPFQITPNNAHVPHGRHNVVFSLQSPPQFRAEIKSIAFKKASPGEFTTQGADQWVLDDHNENAGKVPVAFPYTTTISYLNGGVATSRTFDPEVDNDPKSGTEPTMAIEHHPKAKASRY